MAKTKMIRRMRRFSLGVAMRCATMDRLWPNFIHAGSANPKCRPESLHLTTIHQSPITIRV
jgi:hypothetical protein